MHYPRHAARTVGRRRSSFSRLARYTLGMETNENSYPSPRDPEALVRQFHEVYHLPVMDGDTPSVDRERIYMRMRLVAEEFSELVGAVYGQAARAAVTDGYRKARELDDHTRDVVETADALGDLTYVIYGLALECGIPMEKVLGEIQASNLSKLGDDGQPIYREDGKVLKGAHFFPPNIRRALGIANDAE